MDSGSAVPTLSSGFRETVAAKLLIVARGRLGRDAGLAGSCRTVAVVSAGLALRLIRRAFFFAEARAGRRKPARMAMMLMMTRSSTSVKARGRSFISHLVGFAHDQGLEHCVCHLISCGKSALVSAVTSEDHAG